MNEQDLREAFDRMVQLGPPAPGGAELVVAGRRARRRRALVPAAAVAVLALVTAVVVTAPAWRPAGDPSEVGRVGPNDVAAPLPVPGFSPAQLRALSLQCATAFAGGDTDPRGVLRQTAAQLRVYNALQDAVGSISLLYLPGKKMTCGVPANTTNTDLEVEDLQHTSLDWLPGPVSLDVRTDSRADADGRPDYQLVAGRVIATAATVVVTGPNGSRTVPVVNDTYLARFVTGNSQITVGGQLTIRAYNRAGDLLGEVPDGQIWTCYRLPTGQQISEKPLQRGDSCPNAVRWTGP